MSLNRPGVGATGDIERAQRISALVPSRPLRLPCRVTATTVACLKTSGSEGPRKNNFPLSAADASRLAALLVGRILPVCSLLAPYPPGASTPQNGDLFLRGPQGDDTDGEDETRDHQEDGCPPGHARSGICAIGSADRRSSAGEAVGPRPAPRTARSADERQGQGKPAAVGSTGADNAWIVRLCAPHRAPAVDRGCREACDHTRLDAFESQ